MARPSLDDVYLRFAGRSFAAAEAASTQTPRKEELPMTAISDTWALTIRDLLRLWRQPWFIAIVLVQPIIWLLLFGALFERVVDIPGFQGGDYKQYLVPGVLVMTAFFSSGWNGMSTIEDLDRGVTDRLLVSPVGRLPLIAGRVGQNLVQVLLQSVDHRRRWRWSIGVSFDGGVLGVLVLIAASRGLLGTAFAALSNALALVARKEESLIGAVTFLQLPLVFLSTAFMQPACCRAGSRRWRSQPGGLGDRGGPRGGRARPGLGQHRRLLGLLAGFAVVCLALANEGVRRLPEAGLGACATIPMLS